MVRVSSLNRVLIDSLVSFSNALTMLQKRMHKYPHLQASFSALSSCFPTPFFCNSYELSHSGSFKIGHQQIQQVDPCNRPYTARSSQPLGCSRQKNISGQQVDPMPCYFDRLQDIDIMRSKQPVTPIFQQHRDQLNRFSVVTPCV